ncbi:MAG: TM2 domain-containing protein [Verrucomicrobia bacterium]|nr:TM2 domain-containing protein [Verrucomicrobiota bacterium]
MNPEQYKKLSMQEQADIWPTLSPDAQAIIKSGQAHHRYAAILNQQSERQRIVYIILALLLGGFGVHNFYAGRTTQAIMQIFISIASLGLLFVGIGLFTYAALGVWLIIEICTVTVDGENLKMK